MILKKEKMRTTQDNDTFFTDLMKLKTTFYWKGHELQLMGEVAVEKVYQSKPTFFQRIGNLFKK